MNKTEAADYLGVSIRTMQRLMTQGRVEFKKVKSEAGIAVAVFERAALDRYKAAAAISLSHPTVSPASEAGIVAESSAVARREASVSLGRFAELRELAELLRPAPAAPVSPLPPKLALTVREAAEYSGYSLGAIKAAVSAGKLKASKLGPRGSLVVKRSDLEAWVKRL